MMMCNASHTPEFNANHVKNAICSFRFLAYKCDYGTLLNLYLHTIRQDGWILNYYCVHVWSLQVFFVATVCMIVSTLCWAAWHISWINNNMKIVHLNKFTFMHWTHCCMCAVRQKLQCSAKLSDWKCGQCTVSRRRRICDDDRIRIR